MTDDHSQHTTLQAANKRRRTARASTSQIEALLAYLERQPFLATRRFTGLQSRENYIFAWEAVAADLNSIPNGATKTADQWITVWRDIKSRACSKAARLQREKKETGNRNINTLPLTEIESRVVSIVGPDYTIGSNCPDSMPESDITQSDSVTGIEMEMGEYEVPSPDTPPEIYLNAATNMAAAVPAVTHTVTGQQFAAFDHTYVTLTSELPTMTSTSRSSLTSRPVTNTVTSSRMSSAAQEQTPPRRNRSKFKPQLLCDTKDGGVAPRLPLSDGHSIPAFGLGTFLGFDENGQKEVKKNEVTVPVANALNAGYRLLDTAQAYLNEDQVGEAVRSSSVPRENIYVVTKLDTKRSREPVQALQDSLKLMNLSYVDLYLIHNPVAFKADHTFDLVDYLDTWKGLEQAKKLGLTDSIGISNFNISQMERLLANCEIKPAVLQVEVNLNLAQNKLIDFCKQHDIVVMAYSPFGGLFSKDEPPPKADDPVLVEIAKKYGKTTPQVALRYLVQKGVIPIPKSTRKEKIEENINIFDFELTSEEMQTLGKFNKDYRTVLPSFWQDHPYYPFEKTDTPAPNIFLPKS